MQSLTSSAQIEEQVKAIALSCKHYLRKHYGDQFLELILYGSSTDKGATHESDIDLLLLLHEPFDYFRELQTIVDLLQPLQLQSDLLISAKPASKKEFEEGSIQLYRNIRREGIML